MLTRQPWNLTRTSAPVLTCYKITVLLITLPCSQAEQQTSQTNQPREDVGCKSEKLRKIASGGGGLYDYEENIQH